MMADTPKILPFGSAFTRSNWTGKLHLDTLIADGLDIEPEAE
jgi:hypothetical protein